jgi:hypothetical protein
MSHPNKDNTKPAVITRGSRRKALGRRCGLHDEKGSQGR